MTSSHLSRFLAALRRRAAPSRPAAAQTPLVPIVSGFRHSDHHWYLWLPGDPVYEAVEVIAAQRGANAVPLVWVFFTERDGPKRQIHFYNDAAIAGLAGAQWRDIAFTMTGSDGEPRGVAVSFADFKGRPVAIEASFGPGARLVAIGAGLTNQAGHSADRHLLLFFRERNAFARTWRVAIAGADVAVAQPGQNRPAPFPAAYSHNIFHGRFPFGDEVASFDGARPGEGKDVVRFAPAGAPGDYSAVLPDGTRVELVAGADAALRTYRHRDGPHALEIGFDPPLPSTVRFTADVVSAFRISFDGFHDLLSGRIHATRRDGAIILNWRFEAPDWTRAHPLRAAVFPSDGGARIELRPIRAGQ
ncbi:MAG: hypothetical protein ABSE69_02450 [Roseiarcus sp.]|jgi:hypothetical protein